MTYSRLSRILTCFLVSTAFLTQGGRPARAAAGPYTWRMFVNTHPAPLVYQVAGIAAGGNGNVFVADSGDHRIEKLTSDGKLLNVWGTDTPGPLRFEDPRAIAVSAGGAIYVGDNGVVKLDSTGRFVARWSGGVLSYPRGLSVDSAGDLYVLSLHPVRFSPLFDRLTVTRLSSAGKQLSSKVFTYDTNADEGVLSAAISTDLHDNLLISIRAQHHCHSCDGTYYSLITISPAGKVLPAVNESAGGMSIATDANANIYLAEPGRVDKLGPDGAVIAHFGMPGCAADEFGADLRVAVSPQGTLVIGDSVPSFSRPQGYRSSLKQAVIHELTLDGAPRAMVGSCPPAGAAALFGQSNDLARAPDGTTYLADGVMSKIYRISPSGAVVGGFDAVHPSTVATDRQGNVYVPDLESTSLGEYAPDGALLARTSGVMVESVAVARNGQIYALSVWGRVLVLPPAGRGGRPLRQWWVRGYESRTGGLTPSGICLDGQGNVWVADIRHNNIQEFTPAGRLLRMWGRGGSAPGRFQNPTALTVDGRGHLWVADSGNSRLEEFDLRGRFLGVFGRKGMAPGQFNGLYGVAADPRGDIYAGDRGNDRVQELVAGG